MRNDRSIAGIMLALAGGLAQAQTTQGLIAGLVFDGDTKQPLAHANIEYLRREHGTVVETGSARTNQQGFYAFPLLPPGTYQIRVSPAGTGSSLQRAPRPGEYQPQEIYELELFVASRLEVNFALRKLTDVWQAGIKRGLYQNSTTAILHYYAADVAQLRSGYLQLVPYRTSSLEATVSYVIDPKSVENLPLAGRDVYTTLVTQPGVTADTGTARGLGLAINGQRPSSSNFMLDGLENNNYLVTGPLSPVAPEAIEEYRVSTNNFSAEYGRTSGYLANAVSRSGGNRFHGIGYFYLKNDALNANDFRENLLGLGRTPVKENQIGFQAGGPILRNRLFFSGSFDRLRSRSFRDPQPFSLPTTTFLRILQQAPANRISRQLLAEFPAPLIVSQALTATAIIAPPVSVDQSTGLERIDYNSRDGLNRIMGRVAISRFSRPNFIWSPYKDFVSGLNENTLGVAVSYVRGLQPGLMNEAKLGRTSDDIGWNRPHPEIPTLVSPDATGSGPLSLPGSPAFYAYSNRNQTWEMLDNLTWIHDRHVFTAGGGALLRGSNGYLTAGRDGQYEFPDVLSFTLDQPNKFTTSVSRQSLPNLQQPDFNREYRYKQYFLFAQDTFRVTSRLTLNYGLRYEQYGAPSNTGTAKDAEMQLGAGQNFGERLASAKLVYPGPGDEQLYKADHNGWAPRFGFSYDLLGEARTLVRGAYGLFYDRPYDNLWQNVRTNNLVLPTFPLRGTVNYLAPVSQELKNFNGNFVDTSLLNLTLFDQNLKNAYVHSYFFGIQQRVRDNWTVEVNTLGSLGRKLIVTDVVNRPYSDGFARFNEHFGNIAYRSGQALSDYNALTAVARYRAGRKQFQISYTWSHTIDEQSEPLAGDFFNLLFTKIGSDSSRTDFAAFSRQFDSRGDRGNSDFDQRHNLVFFSVWDLPSGLGRSKAGWLFRDWRFSQLAAFRSGFPYSVREPLAIDFNNPAELYNGRADVIDPKNAVLAKPVSVPGGELLLNAAAFTQSTDGLQGNTGRNAFRGPGLYNIDISLSRSFPLRWLGEAARLTFRADAFNFLNHANLNNPQPLINQPDFGVALYGRQGVQSGFPAVSPLNETARQIQLLLRVEF